MQKGASRHGERPANEGRLVSSGFLMRKSSTHAGAAENRAPVEPLTLLSFNRKCAATNWLVRACAIRADINWRCYMVSTLSNVLHPARPPSLRGILFCEPELLSLIIALDKFPMQSQDSSFNPLVIIQTFMLFSSSHYLRCQSSTAVDQRHLWSIHLLEQLFTGRWLTDE